MKIPMAGVFKLFTESYSVPVPYPSLESLSPLSRLESIRVYITTESLIYHDITALTWILPYVSMLLFDIP